MLILCASLLLVRPALAQNLPKQQVVNWEKLTLRDGLFTEAQQHIPFSSPIFTLETQHSVKVLLPGDRHFYLQFHDDENQKITPERFRTEAELEINQVSLLLSDTPGISQQITLTPVSALLPAVSYDRVLQITNAQNSDLNIAVFSGQQKALRDFAPLSWLSPTEADSKRFKRTDNRSDDFFQSQQAGTVAVAAEQEYWLESLQPTSQQWQNSAVEFLQIQPHRGQAQIAPIFSNHSAKTAFVPETETVKVMTSTQFSATEDDEVSLKSTAPTWMRVQSMQADWLFDDNYQTLSVPAVTRKKQESALHADWHKQSSPALSDTLILNSMAHQATNRWLAEKTLTASASGGFREQQIQAETRRWDFAGETRQQPDLAASQIHIAQHKTPNSFSLLSQQSPLSFSVAHDQASNRIAIEMLTQDDHQDAIIKVLLDNQHYTTLNTFTDPELHAYVRNTTWQTQQARTTDTAYIARQTLYLPAGWKTLTLVTEQNDVPVRIRYQIRRTPELDRPQWQALLALPAAEQATQLAHHPLWQEYQHYQAVKGLEFNGDDVPDMWQAWLQQQRITSTILDHPVINSMPESRRIQKALLYPRMQDWSFWSQLFSDLQLAGWQTYAENLLTALVLYHPDNEVQGFAIARLLAHYQSIDNLAEQTNLLINVMQGAQFQTALRESARLALARLYLTLNKPDYTLFTLLSAKDSDRKQLLTDTALFRLHPTTDKKATADAPTNIPGDRHIRSAAQDFISHIRSQAVIQLHNVELNVPQKNYLVTPDNPLEISLSAATKLHFTTRQWFAESHGNDDWLSISQHQQHYKLPLNNSDYRSSTLRHPEASVGAGHKFAVAVAKAGVLTIRPLQHPVVINIQQSLSETQTTFHTDSCVRDNTRSQNQHWWYTVDEPKFECAYWQSVPAEIAEFAVTASYLPSLTEQHRKLLNQLYQFEREATQNQLNQINQQAAQLSDSAFVHMLLRRANKNASWVALNFPTQTKKFTFYSTSTNEPLSPEAIRGRLLYTPYQPDWEKLATQSTLNYELLTKPGEEYRLLVQSQQHLFQRDATSRVLITLNGQAHSTLQLRTGELKTQLLPLTPGKHTLSLSADYLSGQNAIIAKLQFRNAQGDWQEQPQDLRLRLFQADQREPFQIFLPEASWLRIDSFDQNGLARHQFVQAQQGMFSWFDEDPAYLGHRVLQLKLQNAADNGLTSEGLPLDLYPSPELRGVQIIASNKLRSTDTRKDYTWGLEGAITQQRSPSEDAAQNNRYQQLRLFFRDQDVTGRYFYGSELAVRRYQSDLQESLHARFDWWDTQWLDNIALQLGLSVNAQQGYQDNDWGWSARVSADAHWQYVLNRRLYNRVSLGVFANILDTDRLPEQYASAVYSQYKLDHKYGFTLAENLRYKWYHDVESWADLKATSNELSDSQLIDNIALTLGSRIYYQGVAVDIGWRWQKYFDDSDRNDKELNQRLGAGLEWFSWQSDNHLRLRLGYERNLSDKENYWSLQLSYIESGHRGVSDYLPQSLAFSSLREQEGLLHALDRQANEQEQQ